MSLSSEQLLNNKRYRVKEQLDQGGYGAVYRAYDRILQQDCALKENLNTEPKAQRQFEKEAIILAQLRHPNLPRVTDLFTVPNQGQYLVMDFVAGQNLRQILIGQGQKPIGEHQAITWIRQICVALAYMHRQDPPIIHRDIKPQNIIIMPNGQAMLVDFGLSKVYDPELDTSTGAQGVTIGYAPPEQYGHGRTDARSDVYALGATLYTLVTAQRPPDSIKLMVNQTRLMAPRQLNGQLSPHLEQVILKAMAPDSSQRFQNVEELSQALTETVQMRPVPRMPVEKSSLPPSSRFWMWGTIIGGILSLVFMGSSLSLYFLGTHGFNEQPLPTATFLTVAAISTASPSPTSDLATPLETPTTTPDLATALASETPTSSPTSEQLPSLTPTSTITPTETETPTPTHTPLPPYQYELIALSGETATHITRFWGYIVDVNDEPVNGAFVQVSCGSFSTISYPSGPVRWRGGESGEWQPGYYDITVDNKPSPCLWTLTVVETSDRKTVEAELSAVATVEVTQDRSSIAANWRKLY